jgi:hypothetical protein
MMKPTVNPHGIENRVSATTSVVINSSNQQPGLGGNNNNNVMPINKLFNTTHAPLTSLLKTTL